MTTTDLLSRLQSVRGNGHQWMAKCPAHDDRKASLSVGNGGDKVLLRCQTGCRTESIVSALGLKMSDLFASPDNGHRAGGKRHIISTFDYQDEQGSLLFQCVRYDPKDFKQRRPDGAGGWIYNLKDTRRVLYRLPELLTDETECVVLIPEGEKHVDRLRELGIPATTNPMGAGKWQTEYSEFLRGRAVAVLPDNDATGSAHASEVAASLYGIANSVKIVELPNLPPKGDVLNWLDMGHSRDELLVLADQAPEWAPGANSEFAVCLATVVPQSVRFLWGPYFPIGKVVMIEGDPGLGKSWLTCAITTAVSRGSGLPGLDKTEPQNVLMMSAEDGLADTIRPRLDLMGADVNRIFAIDEPLTLDDPGLIRVESCLAQYRPALLVIDPLVAFLGAKVDIHRANETRQVMARLAHLAERYECVIVVVRHLRKSTSDRAIYRGAGSIDFTAACRSVLLVGADPNDRNKRAMVHIKSNLAMLGPSIAFQIDERGFYWDGRSELTADDVFSTASSEEDLSALDEAKNFLRELLADGPERVSKIQKQTKDAGITTATLRRARKSLGVQSNPSKDADGKVQFWVYSLPSW